MATTQWRDALRPHATRAVGEWQPHAREADPFRWENTHTSPQTRFRAARLRTVELKHDMFLTQRWDTLGPQDSRASCVGSGVDQPFVWDTHTLSASAHHISSRRARTHRFSLGNARRGWYKHDAHWQHHLLGTFQFTEPSTYSITPLTSRRVHGGTEHDEFLLRSGGMLFGHSPPVQAKLSTQNFPGPRSRTRLLGQWRPDECVSTRACRP
jgi:hypothetical protein